MSWEMNSLLPKNPPQKARPIPKIAQPKTFQAN